MTTDDPTGTDAGTTTDDAPTDEPTLDDLAAVGAQLDDDGTAWKAAARAFGSYPDRDPTADGVLEIVAGQVYATLDESDPAAADTVETFVERFQRVYELDDADAVATLLGRESYERQAYEGRLAFQDGGAA
jgi:hypothetical protein